MRRRPTLVMAFWQQAELFLCSYIMQCSIVFSPSVSLGGSDEDPERFGGEISSRCLSFQIPLVCATLGTLKTVKTAGPKF